MWSRSADTRPCSLSGVLSLKPEIAAVGGADGLNALPGNILRFFLRDFVQLPLDQRVAHAFRFPAGVILQILGQRQQLFAHLLTLAGGEV